MIDVIPLLIAALFGTGAAPEQPSFNCAKAAHPLEKTICKSDTLALLDSQVAESYREKLGIVFDKVAFRAQQRNWQQVLRSHCAKSCDPAEVERDYTRQLAFLDGFREEDWSASYKTADVAYLHIAHEGPMQFSFSIKRDLEGDKPESLCALEGDSMIATFLDRAPQTARWVGGGACTVDFGFDRDKTGHVTRIAVTSSAGCKRYCPNKRYSIGDTYTPDNVWAAGNQ
jgi:uncharacterized protein